MIKIVLKQFFGRSDVTDGDVAIPAGFNENK
jgi:hypothetical protein